jgi:hypothetical protein
LARDTRPKMVVPGKYGKIWKVLESGNVYPESVVF